jgi:hypothetical protein
LPFQTFLTNFAPSLIQTKNFMKHTKEHCEKAARQCSTLQEFYQKFKKEAYASYRYGYMKDFTWLKKIKKLYWDHDRCLEEAKKYNTLKDFRYKSYPAYQNACKYKWLDEYTWLHRAILKPNHNHWTYQKAYDEAKKYTSRKELLACCRKLY